MNEIKEFLASNPNYSFEDGLALLKKYQPNKGVIDFIENRKDVRHLGYELGRFSRYPRLMPVHGYKAPGAAETAPEVLSETKPQTQPAAKSKAKGNEDIVKLDDIEQRYKNTRRDDMPTPYLKQVWDNGADTYRELQFAHLKMAEAASKEEGEEWRKKVLKLNDKLRANWKTIDEEIKRLNSTDKDKGEAESFKESSCRAYITKKLKKQNLTAADIVEIRKRVELLQKHDCKFTPEMTKKLKKIQVL